MPVKISLAQMHIIPGNPEANLYNAANMAREAQKRGSSLMLLPELWSSGYDLKNRATFASSLDTGIFETMRSMAVSHSIAIGGSCLERDGDNFYNTFSLYTSTGIRVLTYRKAHLFRLMHEDRWLAAGDAPSFADTPYGRTGAAICYDLRFPELIRQYALNGAQIVLISAEWPQKRIAHWTTLLRARAIENQLYIVACNCTGKSGEEQFGGHSMVIDPWGEILVEAGTEESLFTAEIDCGTVDSIRSKFPFLKDSRPEIYK